MLKDDSKIEGFFDAGARRAEEADPFVNARTKFDEVHAHASETYYPLDKLGLRLDGQFTQRDYQIAGMSDIRTKSINGDVTFESTPKLRYFGGVGGRWVKTYDVPPSLPPMDSEDFKARIGAEGDISSKVTGLISAGWVHRRFRIAQGGDRSGLLLDTAVVWRPDDETSITARMTRDFDTTPIDQSVMQLSTGFDIRRTFREKMSATTSLAHCHSNFVGVGVSRHDNAYVIKEAIDYNLTRRVTAGIFTSYNLTHSDNAFSDYTRFIAGISVAAIY